ncbi:hypothetical protein [Vibrio diabolicus]|uniref:hypothetical protein n=1 Tax=Vibrio diabolicus TaxID=50719 RepID=UPI0040680AEA
MEKTGKEKLILVNRYMYRTILKMFTPSVSQDFKYLLEDLTESEESFARKIDEAHSSLQNTAHLVERLEVELSTKLDRVSKLKVEHERYSQLAKLEEDKSRAILNQLDISLNKGKRSERVIAFFINLAAGVILFVLGIWLGPYVTEWLGI